MEVLLDECLHAEGELHNFAVRRNLMELFYKTTPSILVLVIKVAKKSLTTIVF